MVKIRRKLQIQKRQIQEQLELQRLPRDEDPPIMQLSEFMNITFA